MVGNLFVSCWNNRNDFSGGWALQTMDHALVGGKTKPQEGINIIRQHGPTQLSYIHNASICTNMKITYTLIIGTFSAIIFCCSSPSSKSAVESNSESTVIQTQNDLPKMVIKSLDESNIDVHALKERTILILFQPDCDHCQREAKEIRENLTAFKEYTLYFISAGEMAAVKKFGETYDLLGQNNVVFALTTVDDVIRNFGGIPAPSVYIYTNQRLVQKFNGEVTIGRILQAI